MNRELYKTSLVETEIVRQKVSAKTHAKIAPIQGNGEIADAKTITRFYKNVFTLIHRGSVEGRTHESRTAQDVACGNGNRAAKGLSRDARM